MAGAAIRPHDLGIKVASRSWQEELPMSKPMLFSLDHAQRVRLFGAELFFTMPAIQPGAGVSIIEQIMPPRNGPPLHLHRNEDEILRVIEGVYRVRIGQDDLEVTAGDTILLPRGVPHTYINCGERACHVIFVVQPGGLERFFVELAGALQVDPAQESRIRAKYGIEYVAPNPFL
jgi:mannose-6-phosphate isomerase-like protein (cupin superfamily)